MNDFSPVFMFFPFTGFLSLFPRVVNPAASTDIRRESDPAASAISIGRPTGIPVYRHSDSINACRRWAPLTPRTAPMVGCVVWDESPHTA